MEPDIFEVLIFLTSLILSSLFMYHWYRFLALNSFLPRRARISKIILACLPTGLTIALFAVLITIADVYVRTNPFYILMYLSMGLAIQSLSMLLFKFSFDISPSYDVIGNDNKAALFPVIGGFLGLGAIFSGANVGDGPGWWCVIVTWFFGVFVYFLAGKLTNLLTGATEKIAVGRNINMGIRFGGYLLSSGIILARAVSGDWISFNQTMLEFLDCWPVIIISMIYVIVELLYSKMNKNTHTEIISVTSVIIAISMIVMSVLSIIYTPTLMVFFS